MMGKNNNIANKEEKQDDEQLAAESDLTEVSILTRISVVISS